MGRHGGRPSGRTRASWPVVAIGVLVVAAVGFGFWLWSVRSVDDPIDAHPVDAYAVVVSSPSCTTGSGSTAVDLNLDTVVRSSLSACGRRVGERIAVQYLAGHPDQARLAGTAVAHNNSAGDWLPIAILAAGLLAVIGTLSLLIDRHRSRHDGKAAGAVLRPTVAQLRAAAAEAPGPAVADASLAAAPGAVNGAGDSAQQSRPTDAAPDQRGESDQRGEANQRREPDQQHEPDASDQVNPDTTSRIAAHAMPGIGSTPLRASDIVDEDLFTHRTHHPAE